VDSILKIAIIASVEFEIVELLRHFGINSIKKLEPVFLNNIIFCLSGAGITNAAIATTIVLERFSPDLVISTGIGGAYPWSGLKVGDIAIAEKEIYGDMGIRFSNGFYDMGYLGLPLLEKKGSTNDTFATSSHPALLLHNQRPLEIFNELPVSKKYIDRAISLSRTVTSPLGTVTSPLETVTSPTKISSGSFVTVCQVSGDPSIAEYTARRFNAICENMEGAAVAHVSAFYGADFFEIRGISNITGERDKDKWNIPVATKNCQFFLMNFLKDLGYAIIN
jgi:futalosine hydrolase